MPACTGAAVTARSLLLQREADPYSYAEKRCSQGSARELSFRAAASIRRHASFSCASDVANDTLK